MRILHYHDSMSFGLGGPVRAVMDLSRLLAAAGHEVTIATYDFADAPKEWLHRVPGAPKVEVLDKPSLPGGFFSAASVRRVEQLVRAADLLHIHGMWTPSNLQFGSAARRAGVPYVVSIRGMLDDWSMSQRTVKKRLFLMLAGRRLLNGAAAVHCTADGELRQARRHAPKANWLVMPNLLDLEPFRTLPGPDLARRTFAQLSAGPRLLYLSRVHYKKGPDILIHAAADLVRTHPNTQVLIAGTGEQDYLTSLRALVQQLKLEQNIHFLGQVVGELKISLYQAADVFVLPSSQENFGFVFFEALAAGTPLVTTNDIDTWPELEASGGGIICARTPEAIAAGVRRAMESTEARAEMGRSGRAWVFEYLDPQRVLSQFLACYERCATRRA